MMDEIGDGVAEAARAGARFGERLQHKKNVDGWADYAASLEQQLSNARAQIAYQSVSLEIKEMEINRYKETNTKLGQEIQRSHKLLAEKDEALANLQSGEQEFRSFSAAKISNIESACAAQSSKLAAFEEIYKMLVMEIRLIDDPVRFKSLDHANRRVVIKKAWDGFLKTGRTIHRPDLTFDYQNEPLSNSLGSVLKPAETVPEAGPKSGEKQ